MPIAAHGLARIVAEEPEDTWIFQPYYGTGYVTNISLVGGWNRTEATITWGGSPPEAQNTDSSVRNVTALTVRFQLTTDDRIFAHIPHATVTLNQNDTIVYTSVEITFETASII